MILVKSELKNLDYTFIKIFCFKLVLIVRFTFRKLRIQRRLTFVVWVMSILFSNAFVVRCEEELSTTRKELSVTKKESMLKPSSNTYHCHIYPNSETYILKLSVIIISKAITVLLEWNES